MLLEELVGLGKEAPRNIKRIFHFFVFLSKLFNLAFSNRELLPILEECVINFLKSQHRIANNNQSFVVNEPLRLVSDEWCDGKNVQVFAWKDLGWI